MNIILKCGECGAKLGAKESASDSYHDFTVTVETCGCVKDRLAHVDEIDTEIANLKSATQSAKQAVGNALAALETFKNQEGMMDIMVALENETWGL